MLKLGVFAQFKLQQAYKLLKTMDWVYRSTGRSVKVLTAGFESVIIVMPYDF